MVTLGQGLQEAGHNVCIATHECFRSFILERGLEYHPIGFERLEQPDSWKTAASVGEMMEEYLEHVEKHYHSIGDHYLNAIRPQDPPGAPQADLIVTTNHTLSFGVNLSEATGIPCWVAKVVPDSPTRAFAPPGELTSSFGWYNYWMHMMFWLRVVVALHRTPMQQLEYTWRKLSLGLPTPVVSNVLESSRYLPSLLGYSNLLFPTPDDYPDWHFPCGFWMSDERDTYDPPPELENFLTNSRRPIVVVNFGSMVHSTSGGLVDRVALQVLARRCKCLVISGWSNTSDLLIDRSKKDKNLMIIPGAPHEYVFQYVHAVVHHGGAGTTARVLASGAVSVIIPILRWSDQPQWAERVVEAGVGVAVFDPNPNSFLIRNALDQALDRRGLERKANILSATVRAEPSLRRSVAAISSCICSMMLTPCEHAAILRLPLPETLNAKQRMCMKHCVHCHVLRTRHLRAFSLQDASSVSSSDANSSSESGEEPASSLRAWSRVQPSSHRFSHPGHAPPVLRPIAWQLLDSPAVQAEQLLRTMHQAAINILRSTPASFHLSDEVRMLLHLTQTERDILQLPPPPSIDALMDDGGDEPSPEPWERRFMPRRSALKRHGSAEVAGTSKERHLTGVLRGSHSTPPDPSAGRRRASAAQSNADEDTTLALQNGTARATRRSSTVVTPRRGGAGRGTHATSPGMALLSPSVRREGDRPPSSYRDLYSARRSVLRPLHEEDFESPASSMRTGRTTNATTTPHSPAHSIVRGPEETPASQTGAEQVPSAARGATPRQQDMRENQLRREEEKNEEQEEGDSDKESDASDSSDDTASTRSRSLESARVLSRAVLSRLGKDHTDNEEEEDVAPAAASSDSQLASPAPRRNGSKRARVGSEEENDDTKTPDETEVKETPAKRRRASSPIPHSPKSRRRSPRIAQQTEEPSPRRKRAASKSASPSPAAKRQQTRASPSPPTTRRQAAKPDTRPKKSSSANKSSPPKTRRSASSKRAESRTSPKRPTSRRRASSPKSPSPVRRSRRPAGVRRSARLRQSTRNK